MSLFDFCRSKSRGLVSGRACLTLRSWKEALESSVSVPFLLTSVTFGTSFDIGPLAFKSTLKILVKYLLASQNS